MRPVSHQRNDWKRGDRFTPVGVRRARTGADFQFPGSGRGPRVVVLLHAATCPECHDYLRSVIARLDAVTEWGGRVLIVAPGSADGGAAILPFEGPDAAVLTDPAGAVGGGAAVALVTDEWGEVFFVVDAGPEHDLPPADELVEWVRFAAIQCPECEGPEGGWRSLGS